MKRSGAVATLIFLLSVAGAAAQTAGAPPPPPPPQQAPAAGAAPMRERAKDVRNRCRDEMRNQGLRGADRRAAVTACVVKERPDLAAREACRQQGREKGMKGDELRAFVRDCRTR